MTSAHLDYETLAELAEGLLDLDHAASADAHLAECADCRERSTEISEVSRLLAEASAPPIPAELVTRIDAAIAEQMPPIRESTRARSGWHGRRFQILSAAAAATVLVGTGVTVTRIALNSDQLAPSAVDSASQPSLQDRAASGDAGKREAEPSVRTASVPFRLVRTGTDYRRSSLTEQVRTAVRATATAAGTDATTDGRTEILLGCVGRIGQHRPPVLVDQATFEGGEATLIVLTGDTPERLDAWVVGPRCSASRSDILQHSRLDR